MLPTSTWSRASSSSTSRPLWEWDNLEEEEGETERKAGKLIYRKNIANTTRSLRSILGKFKMDFLPPAKGKILSSQNAPPFSHCQKLVYKE